jgi:hypothetical protein
VSLRSAKVLGLLPPALEGELETLSSAHGFRYDSVL